MEDKQIKDDARMSKLKQQAALRQAYESQMAQKDAAKRNTRQANDQFADEYKNHLASLDQQRAIPKSASIRQSQDSGQNYGTGLQIGGPSLAPTNIPQQRQNSMEDVYTGLPIGYANQPNNQQQNFQRQERPQYSAQKENINYGAPQPGPKSKVQLNREKQMNDQQYTGFNIGALPEQSKNDKNRATNNYHAMLDEQVQLKREAQRNNKHSEEAQMQDALDFQRAEIERSQHERTREQYQGPQMQNDNMSHQSEYDIIRARNGNGSKGYNILTGN